MKEQKWRLTYKLANGTIKTCFPNSEEKRKSNLVYCQSHGIEVLECVKLYPFASMKNQHNFELISNICFNAMHDMCFGEAEWNEAEYDRLKKMKEKADRFFCLPFPIAWIPYSEWKDAKELSEMAILHRQDACIAAGRPDLVTYC